MTLPEVMIALSIMSGIGLVTAKLMGDQATHQNQIKMSAEVNTFVSTLQNYLSDSTQCKNMFKDKMLTPGSDFTLGSAGTLDSSLLTFGSKTILAEKDYGMFSLDDQSVKLKESNYGSNQTITPNTDGSVKAGTGVYDLNITFTPKVKSSLFTSNPTISKSIPIVLSFTTTGGNNPRTITGCGPVIADSNVTAKKSLCDALGGYAKWYAGQCVLQEVKCTYPQAMVTVTMKNLGSKICAPVANQVDLNTIFNTSSVPCTGTGNPSISIGQSSGKFTLSCSKTPTSTSCSTACDCPGTYDVCSRGVCVSRSATTCTTGDVARGDASCQQYCTSTNNWNCSATLSACGTTNVNCVGSWSSCVGGIKTYTVTTPKQGSGTSCPNVTGDTQSCSTCTPVNGGWTGWGPYSACTGGMKYRYRTCSNPAASCGGAPCSGSTMDTPVGCGGCFVAGTEISMANGDKKNIEDVLLGEKVKDAGGKAVNVKQLLSLDYWGEIYSINGGPYFFTPNHPFLAVDGWKSLAPEATKLESPGLEVTKLQVGDVLMKKDGLEVIMSLDVKITKEKVYNFVLDGSHSYLADEYKVHNKCAPSVCNPGYIFFSCDPTNCSGSCVPDTSVNSCPVAPPQPNVPLI